MPLGAKVINEILDNISLKNRKDLEKFIKDLASLQRLIARTKNKQIKKWLDYAFGKMNDDFAHYLIDFKEQAENAIASENEKLIKMFCHPRERKKK